MSDWLGGAFDLIGGLVSTGMETSAASAATKQQYIYNRNLQWDQQLFNRVEAEKQRQWEQMMSSTAYQRQKEDLIAAGYNPLLAVNAGGATTPSGSAATSALSSVSSPHVPSFGGLERAFRHIGLDLRDWVHGKFQDEEDNRKADIAIKREQARSISADADLKRKEADTYDVDTERSKRRYGQGWLMENVGSFARWLSDALNIGVWDDIPSSAFQSSGEGKFKDKEKERVKKFVKEMWEKYSE